MFWLAESILKGRANINEQKHLRYISIDASDIIFGTPLVVAPLRHGSSMFKHSLPFDDTDTNILSMSVQLLLFVYTELKTVFRGLIFWRFVYRQLRQMKNSPATYRVKSGEFGRQVNSDIHLQTV